MSRMVQAVRDRVAPESESFGRLDEVVSLEQLRIGPLSAPTRLRRQMTSRATSSGVDRAFHAMGGRTVAAMRGMRIVEAINCRDARCEVLEELGVIVAELVFDHPLERGESYHYGFTISYPEDPGAATNAALRMFRRRGGAYTLEVNFEGPPPCDVRQVYRPHLAEVDTVVSRSVQCGHGDSFYATVASASPGLHGLTWD